LTAKVVDSSQVFIGRTEKRLRKPRKAHTCAEKQNIGKTLVLHAVIKMVEPTHRGYLAGESLKLPKGAERDQNPDQNPVGQGYIINNESNNLKK